MSGQYIRPQLAFDAGKDLSLVPRDRSWVIEPKYDGWRFQVHVLDGEVVSFGGRNGKQHATPSQIADQLLGLPAGTVLDGELVAGGASFDVGRTSNRGKQTLVVFDILAAGGFDVTARPWQDRRRLLEVAIPRLVGLRLDVNREVVVANVVVSPVVYDPEQFDGTLDRWYASGFEGAVAKRIDAPYRPGSRRRDGFLKVKSKETTEAVVIGWEYGKGQSNKDRCGALHVTLSENDVDTWCGFGATSEEADAMVGRLIELQHYGWQPSGKVRHPGFVRLRPDLEEI